MAADFNIIPVSNGKAQTTTGNSSTLVLSKKIMVSWENTKENKSMFYRMSGHEKPILPLFFKEDNTVNLIITIENFSNSEIQSLRLDRVGYDDKIGGYSDCLPIENNCFDDKNKIFKLNYKIKDIPKSFEVNKNLFEAMVAIICCGKEYISESQNLLHILRQKLILFIPGVCGSEITVREHPEGKAYPQWSLLGEIEFKWLECDENGDPTKASEAIKVDLLESFSGKSVYDLPHNYVNNPNDYPVLYPYKQSERKTIEVKEGRVKKRYYIPRDKPLCYYILQTWPYDWRLRLEYSVDALMAIKSGKYTGSDDAILPSISEIIKEYKESDELPFLDEKIAIVGHSTGGLITRGALRRKGIVDLVDNAFFIDVPFQGAPKVYYVYLGGDMLPFVSNDIMRNICPNTPIIYYLAPTAFYKDEVLINDEGTTTKTYFREKNQNVGILINTLVNKLRETNNYPPKGKIADWNSKLEKDANAYHLSIRGEPLIGWDNCTVFYSTNNDTPGAVFLEKGMRTIKERHEVDRNLGLLPKYKKIDGDITVPTKSQIDDFPQKCLNRIPSSPKHVDSPNEKFVWEKIINELRIEFQPAQDCAKGEVTFSQTSELYDFEPSY